MKLPILLTILLALTLTSCESKHDPRAGKVPDGGMGQASGGRE